VRKFRSKKNAPKVLYFPGAKEAEHNNATMQKSAIRLTKKEVKTLPNELQDKITIELTFPVRQKPNGVFEVRYRAHGFNVGASSLDFDELKPKFIEALRRSVPKEPPAPDVQSGATFETVAARWLELKRPTIKPTTYNYYVQLFGANIFPVLAGRKLADIKQSDVQRLINDYVAQEKYRTATKIFQTLQAVFTFAVGEELLDRSPMRMLKPPKYEEQNGVALTLEEERELLQRLDGSNCSPAVRAALVFLLYTGLRRSELASAKIVDGCVEVTNAKTRKGFKEKRRIIPVTPMLAPYLPGFNIAELNALRPDALTQAFKRLMPEHHLHELRHTFTTRCRECGVPREVVSVWVGHAPDNTQTSNVYTHFSREFMKKEAQKVRYSLT